MAKGFTYFKVDTDHFQDIRIKKLRRAFGTDGYAVWSYILNEIYRNGGGVIEWDENTAYDVADYWDLKETTVSEIVNYCVAVGLFSKELLSGGRILTSRAIQERYAAMCHLTKRKLDINEKWLLIGDKENETDNTESETESEHLSREKDDLSRENTDLSRQKGDLSRVFETKKRKEKNISDDCLTTCEGVRTCEYEGEIMSVGVAQTLGNMKKWREALIADEGWMADLSRDLSVDASELPDMLEEFCRQKKAERRVTDYSMPHLFIRHFSAWVRKKREIELNKQEQHETGTSNFGAGEATGLRTKLASGFAALIEG